MAHTEASEVYSQWSSVKELYSAAIRPPLLRQIVSIDYRTLHVELSLVLHAKTLNRISNMQH